MIKIKSQKITPNILGDSQNASFVLSSQDLGEEQKDWDFYAVFDFQAPQPINSQVAMNIITDVFSHTLLLDNAQAVLQVMEKAVKESQEALQKMQPELVFNAVAAVFKDDFTYISIYGKSRALYLDGTQIAHVDTEKEGNYAGTAQKVEGGKVMVLCTNNFYNKFPPKMLVSLAKPILSNDLDDLSSAVIIKVDKEVVVVDADTAKQVPVSDSPEGIKEAVNYIKSKSNHRTKTKSRLRLVIYILLALLVASVAFILIRRFLIKPITPAAPEKRVTAEQPSVKEVPTVTEQVPQVQGELTKKLDEANKVKRVTAQVFYDVSITDAKTSPTELAQGTNYLAVSDTAQGKIYISSKSVTKFEELPQLFPGIKNLLFDGDTLIFTDNEGIKFYSLTTKSVSKSYMADAKYPKIGTASEYMGFTYAVSDDSLVKFAKSGTKLLGTLWLQKPEFANSVSIDIDGSIYVLFSNGSLEKYTAGAKDDFSIVGLDKPIQRPLKVVTDVDFKQIYVADATEGRILVFDTDGVLDFQLKPQLGSEWASLKSFDISDDEKSFYVLSGTKVFEFKL